MKVFIISLTKGMNFKLLKATRTVLIYLFSTIIISINTSTVNVTSKLLAIPSFSYANVLKSSRRSFQNKIHDPFSWKMTPYACVRFTQLESSDLTPSRELTARIVTTFQLLWFTTTLKYQLLEPLKLHARLSPFSHTCTLHLLLDFLLIRARDLTVY